MYYEINVSLHGTHFFATAKRSIINESKLKQVAQAIGSKFPESEGYKISITCMHESGSVFEPDKLKEFLSGDHEEKRSKLMDAIKAKYPALTVKHSEEFNPIRKGFLWVVAEDARPTEKNIRASDGYPLFEYNSTLKRYGNTGVHHTFTKLVQKFGFYCEWYDTGTLFLRNAN
jgi:hypothetical protein